MLAILQASFLLSTGVKHPRMAWEVSSKFYKTSVGEEFRESLQIPISYSEIVVLLNPLTWE